MSMDIKEEIEEEITEYSTPSCSIESDLCICTGTCPEFINSWEEHNTSNNILGSGVATCISTKIGDSTRIDSGNVIVNGKIYKQQTFGACPNIMTSAGSTTLFSSSLLVLSVLISTIIGLELAAF